MLHTAADTHKREMYVKKVVFFKLLLNSYSVMMVNWLCKYHDNSSSGIHKNYKYRSLTNTDPNWWFNEEEKDKNEMEILFIINLYILFYLQLLII